MNELLPIRFPVEVEDLILQDLLINLGAARQHHANVPHPVLDGGDLGEFIQACGSMEAASQTMWGYLLDRICLPPGYPARLRDVLCLREMCRVFQYEARIVRHGLNRSDGEASWEVQVAVFDRKGERISDSVARSRSFSPTEDTLLSEFYATAADAFRDAARALFPFGAPYDERDHVAGATLRPLAKA